MKFALCFVLVGLTATAPLYAQTANGTDKTFQIPRVDTAPELDGILAPGEWEGAIVIDDFHEIRPVEFNQTKARTIFRLMYTEDALYVGTYSYQDPASINAKVLRHGARLADDDRVHIMLDPFNNKRSGYLFVTNANGVRYDGLYAGGTGSANSDWDGIWDVASQLVEDGWTSEMRIPFKTLSFDPNNPTWGVNFWREETNTLTRMGWVSRNGQNTPSSAGTMSGLSGLNQGVGLDLTPSVSTTYSDHAQTGDSSEINPSLDLAYKLTPSLNLTLTLNTDFAATEVDDINLDLGRFSTRLSEKRSFFLTDMDIFSFASSGNSGGSSGGGGGNNSNSSAGDSGPDPFFSRNIGLNDGHPVDLNAGVKLSGRAGGFDLGTLIIRQDEFESVDATNIFVGRLKRTVLTESEIGVIYTNGDPDSNDESSTLGVDFSYRNNRLDNNRSLQADFWMLQSDNPGISSDNQAWNASFSMPSNNSWYLGGRVQEIGENFDPRLGFSNREGVRQYAVTAGNNWILGGHPWLQRIQTGVNYKRYNYLDDGSLQSNEFDFTLARITAQSGDVVGLDFKMYDQVLRPGDRAPLSGLGVVIPPGEYEYNEWGVSINSEGSRPWNVQMRSEWGDYYTGERLSLNPTLGWRPSKHLGFELEYDFVRFKMPDATVYTRIAKLTNEIAFSPSLSMINLVQYENVSDSVGINSRFRWNLRAGQDVWLVLSHNMIDPEEDGNFTRLETSASVKVSYTLRY